MYTCIKTKTHKRKTKCSNTSSSNASSKLKVKKDVHHRPCCLEISTEVVQAGKIKGKKASSI